MAEELAEDSVVMREAKIAPGGPVHAALTARADVMAMTEAVHGAALTPADPGGLSHGLRAALAARISRIHAQEGLAAHYDAMLAKAAPEEEVVRLADPAASADDPWLAAILAYTDRVAAAPREAGAGDIEAMRAAGVADADMVRLSELIAFLAYQLRLVAGLKLMQGA